MRAVRVIRVPACARVSRVSRVCPGSPRCLFTGTVPGTTHVHETTVTLFASVASGIDMMLGQPFPANIENLYVFDKPFVRDDVLTGKRVIVVSLPGAFTPV